MAIQPGRPEAEDRDGDEDTRLRLFVRTRRRLRGAKGERVTYDDLLNFLFREAKAEYGEGFTVEDDGGELKAVPAEEVES